jgi:uncharacterized protein
MPPAGPTVSTRKKKVRPVRAKHVPVRTCVSCRESGAKRGLTRLVRTPEGEVEIDLTGKKNGRGAYLCEKPSCWERALSQGVLARALNVTLTPTSISAITEFAASLVSHNADALDAAHSEELAS